MLFSLLFLFGFISCAPVAEDPGPVPGSTPPSSGDQPTSSNPDTPKPIDSPQPAENNTTVNASYRAPNTTNTVNDTTTAPPGGGGGVVPTMDGPPGIMGGGGYPRAIRLKDGSLLGSFSGGDGSDDIIRTVTSNDEGATWSPLGEVARRPRGTCDLDNNFAIQLPSGNLVTAYRNHDVEVGKYKDYNIDVSGSTDGGKTWTYLSKLAHMKADGFKNGNWEPFLRNAEDDTLQGYYSHTNNAGDQDNFLRTSTDGGNTWSDHSTISSGQGTRDGMVGIAQSTNPGSLIAVFECGLCGGGIYLKSVSSTDDGKTWGNRKDVWKSSGNRNNAGAPQVVNVGGTLVASFMTDEDTSMHKWPRGSSTKIITSGDGGASWGNELTVGEPQSIGVA